MKIEIKNYQSCAGAEGNAYSCTLYLDGKRAARVQYDGWGGEPMFDFTPSDKKGYGGPVCERFRAYIASLPKEQTDIADKKDPTGYWHMQPSMDSVVQYEINEMLSTKRVKGWCRTRVVYRYKGDPDGEYLTLATTWTSAKADAIRSQIERNGAKQGKEIEEIFNERFAA